MRSLITALSLAALLASSTADARSMAAPQISEGYAKKVAAKAVRQENLGRSYPYKVKLDARVGLGITRTFSAKADWGKMNHIRIALPTYRGTIDMTKYGAAKGVDRVTLMTRGNQPNH